MHTTGMLQVNGMKLGRNVVYANTQHKMGYEALVLAEIQFYLRSHFGLSSQNMECNTHHSNGYKITTIAVFLL